MDALKANSYIMGIFGFIFVQHLRGFYVCCAIWRFSLYPRLDKCHRRSQIFPLPSADFDSSEGLVSFSEFIFYIVKMSLLTLRGLFERLRAPAGNEAQEMTPKLLALAKVCSVLGNIRDVSWHLSKHGNELEKR